MFRTSFFVLALFLLDSRVGDRVEVTEHVTENFDENTEAFHESTEHSDALSRVAESAYVLTSEHPACDALRQEEAKLIGIGGESTQGSVSIIPGKMYAYKQLPKKTDFDQEAKMYASLKEAEVRHILGFHGTCCVGNCANHDVLSEGRNYIVLDLVTASGCKTLKPTEALEMMIEFAFDLYVHDFADTDHGFHLLGDDDHNIFCTETDVVAYDFGYARVSKDDVLALITLLKRILHETMLLAANAGQITAKLKKEVAKLPQTKNVARKFAGTKMTPAEKIALEMTKIVLLRWDA